jgi:hypothetical protein
MTQKLCGFLILVAFLSWEGAGARQGVAEPGKGPAWKIHDATPGAIVDMKEIRRTKISGKTLVFYRLETAGFPEGKSYGLWVWNFGVDEPWLMMKDFTADPAGRLMCEHPIPPEQADGGKNRSCPFDLGNLELRTPAMAKGIPYRVAILSTDSTVKAFARTVPLPLEFKQGGCTLSAEITSNDATSFLVQGEGFSSGETVAWTAEMGGSDVQKETVASEKGKFVVALNPGEGGKESGKVVFTARGKSCDPTLIFKWGPPALK